MAFTFFAGTTFTGLTAPPIVLASTTAPVTAAVTTGAVSKPAPKPAPTVVRELTDKRTETSDEYLMSDGSKEAKLYPSPVRFKNGQGAWQDVNTSLVPGGDVGDVVAASLPASETFADAGGSQPTAQISTKKWSVGMDLLGATDGGKIAIGDTVHYPNVAQDTELQYQTSASGMKDTLVLSSANAPNTFRFFMSLKNLQVENIPGVGPALFGPDSETPVLTLGKLRVFDSSAPVSKTAVCADAQLSVTPAPGGAYVTYTVPQAWLSSPDRVFPVRVDPSMNLSASCDTYVHSTGNLGEQDYNHWLYSGYEPTYDGECYSLLYFDTAPLKGAVIDSATLQLTAWSGDTGAPQALAKNTDSWDPSIIYSDGLPACSFIASSTLPASGIMQFNVTRTAQDWSRGIGPDDGFQLYSPKPGDSSTLIGYASSEAIDPCDRPVLTVNYPAPAATASATASATGLSWYQGSSPDDQASAGRGRVSLTWPAVSNATGYKIMAFDGSDYRQVGDVVSSATTSWDTSASGLFPSDSTINSMPANNTSNAFAGAATPGGGSMISSATVTDSSLGAAGITLTDGSYLYVRRFAWASGPATWHKVGSGFGGTVKGQDYGTIGSDLSSRWARSAFLMNGKLWNGFTDQPTQLEGYSLNATSGTSPSYMSFSKPLLNMWSGADATSWYSGSVFVAADSAHIYSAAISLNNGNDWDGFRVRVYDTSGNWIADHNIPMRSHQIEGLISDGSALYFIGATGDDASPVTKVRLSDFTVVNQFTLNQSNGQAPGCYDSTNNCFWLGREYNAPNIYCYQAPGLDLRDDPRALYSKMSSAATMSTDPRYQFKVVPYNADAVADVNACATATVELPKRSVSANDDPRHTTFDLGKVGTSEGQAQLDKGALTLSKTDLDVNSYGPGTSLSRSYNSASTGTGYFGPGWRFNFERNLSIDTTGATYADEDRDAHRFVKSGSTYVSPAGDYDSLIATSVVTANGTAAYELLHADKRSFELFSSSGVLLTDTDANNNTVNYKITASEVDITAANGNKIVLLLQGGGHATATYSAGTVTRQVAYTYAVNGNNATGTAAYTFSDTSTGTPTPGYTETYVYTNSRLARVSESQAATIALQGGSSATWDVGYSPSRVATSALSTITAPYYNATQRAVTSIGYGTDSAGLAKATVTQSGEVTGTVQSVFQAFGINPSGTMAYKTNPYTSGVSNPPSWKYEYSANEDELSETNPDRAVNSSTYDANGNQLTETNEMARVTTHAYSAANDLVQTVDPRGSVQSFGYDSCGNQTSETKTLNATATACTLDSYDGNGRKTLERQELYVDGNGVSHWATTANTYGAAFDDPTKTDHRGDTSTDGITFTAENVDLGNGVANGPSQLAETATFDALGDKLTSVDASSFTTTFTVDAAGRQLSSKDASSLVSVSVYDGLGRAIGSYKQAGSSVIGYVTNSIDPFDRTTVTSTWRTNGATSTAVLDHTDTNVCDAMGRQLSQADSLVSGQPSRTYFDASGNAIKSWALGLSATQTADPVFSTRSAFDAEGRTAWSCEPKDTVGTTTTYRADGSVATVSNPDGTSATDSYNAAGDKVAETKNDNSVTRWGYDLAGRSVVATDEVGVATASTYDLADRATGAQAGGKPASANTYNALGWTVSKTDADGIVTTDLYDATGRVALDIAAAQSAAPKRTTSSYDATGKLLKQTDPDGKIDSSSYDPFGRPLEESQVTSAGVVKDTIASYDSLSRVTGSTDARTGIVTTNSYPTALGQGTSTGVTANNVTTAASVDSAGNEISRVSSGPGFSQLTRSVTSTDAAGHVTAWSFGSGRTGQRTFDGDGHVTGQSGTEFTSAGTYHYDTSGRKDSENLPFLYGGTWASGFAYDAVGRLTSATGSGAGSFTYDAASNISTFTATINGSGTTTSGVLGYDAANRLSTRKTLAGALLESYGWDTSHGWRTSQKRSGESSVTYTYSGAGGLQTYNKPAGAQGVAATITAAYTYDALGQRLTSTVTSGSLTTNTKYTYAGLTLLSLVATPSAGASYSVTYLYDGDGRAYGGVYRTATVTPVPFRLVTTDRGDVAELSEWSTSNAFAAYRYDAWGRPLSVTTRAAGSITAAMAADIAGRQPLRYAGYVWDSESGTYYLLARTYDPAAMQFLQKDPAKADGEESAYQYCGGDSVGKTDPSGRTNPARKVLGVANYKTRYTCWAACLHVIMGYEHTWATEADIVHKAFPSWTPTHRVPSNIDLQLDEIANVLHKYRFSCEVRGVVDWGAITGDIGLGRPMYMMVDDPSKHIAHGEVIDGYNEVSARQGVVFMDPFPKDGRGHMQEYSDLINGVFQWENGHTVRWVGTIRRIHR